MHNTGCARGRHVPSLGQLVTFCCLPAALICTWGSLQSQSWLPQHCAFVYTRTTMPTCSSTTCLRSRSTVSLWRASLAATAFLSCCRTASSASNCGHNTLVEWSGDEAMCLGKVYRTASSQVQ